METKRFLPLGGGILVAVLLIFFFSFTTREVFGANQNLIAQLPDSPDGAGTPSTNIPTRPPSSNTTQQQTVPPTTEGARGILEQKKDYTLLAPLNYGNCTQVQQDIGEYKTVCTISTSNVGTFFNTAVYSLIGLAALAAVIRIVYGGFLYLGSETFSLKEQGKEAIWNAIWGLIMVLSVYIILNTINPNLLNLNLNLKELTGKIKIQNQPTRQERVSLIIENNSVPISENNPETDLLPGLNLKKMQGNAINTEYGRATVQEYNKKCEEVGGTVKIKYPSVSTGRVETTMVCVKK